MTPQCFHDVMVESEPFVRINVHKTGHNLKTMVKNCVKFVVLAIVPVDDIDVIAYVNAWPDEVDFTKTIGRMCDLTKVSAKYSYNSPKMSTSDLKNILTDKPYRKDFDAIIRPTLEGYVCSSTNTFLNTATS